ncbi:MAG: aminotransferase class III-fold pyridoxal phosphate-dependent enzyme [Myxococcales bacterium]|nr:aminotransferase class III-fold pyridoxal phosphate-dependent enzyme [Myxococcales bacterium]
MLTFLRSGYSHGYPTFLVRGSGAFVWDASGRRWLDWVQGKGAVTLGHACPEVDEAVARRASEGVLLGACPAEYEELAGCLARWLPGVEQALFVKNGSDAIHAACLAGAGVPGSESSRVGGLPRLGRSPAARCGAGSSARRGARLRLRPPRAGAVAHRAGVPSGRGAGHARARVLRPRAARTRARSGVLGVGAVHRGRGPRRGCGWPRPARTSTSA